MRPVANPPNPWASTSVEYLDDIPPATLQVFEEQARSIVSENDSPDIGFRWSINPYRGCFHGCAYCYARPSHQWLGFGAGTDFERKLVVKTNAPELLRAHFARRSWSGELVVFSGVTDCYQPLEASYELTRRCLEVCLAYRNPVGVITKGALVRRDRELLGRLARTATATVTLSIPFADEELARRIEPFAGSPARRLDAMRALAEAGVAVGVAVAPVIPGLNDRDIPRILTAAREAGATRAGMILVRLAGSVAPYFEQTLRERLPGRAESVLARIRRARGGRLATPGFGERMRGTGPEWEAIEALFDVWTRKLGYDLPAGGGAEPAREEPPTAFRRPGGSRQIGLFGAG